MGREALSRRFLGLRFFGGVKTEKNRPQHLRSRRFVGLLKTKKEKNRPKHLREATIFGERSPKIVTQDLAGLFNLQSPGRPELILIRPSLSPTH